ncbi:hypothetical protein [Mesobacillus subterraneus]|uniref:Uncharacterized protein n=2 Tax=Mesobacillus TaxID=2675231 RepID=A0A0D6Z698_9BACI|nr:hypothetical protein [Mesobacillus subterraneus]KIY20581.1 hypothetical protein UB32_18315 [Mesobacillus subterraneus]
MSVSMNFKIYGNTQIYSPYPIVAKFVQFGYLQRISFQQDGLVIDGEVYDIGTTFLELGERVAERYQLFIGCLSFYEEDLEKSSKWSFRSKIKSSILKKLMVLDQ